MGIYRKGENWYIDYYFKGKRVREKVSPSKKEAKDALSTRQTEILQGRYNGAQLKQSPRFETLAEEYLKYSKANKRSWERDEASLRPPQALFQKALEATVAVGVSD